MSKKNKSLNQEFEKKVMKSMLNKGRLEELKNFIYDFTKINWKDFLIEKVNLISVSSILSLIFYIYRYILLIFHF